MFTTVGNNGDLVTQKPNPTNPSQNARDLRWFKDAIGGALGSKITLNMLNDLLLNIRAAATAAGISLNTRPYGDENILRDIVQGIGGTSISYPVDRTFSTPAAATGPVPLILYALEWHPIVAGISSQAVGTLRSCTLSLEATGKTQNTNVTSRFMGTFNCTLVTVAANGSMTNTTANAADVGKSVYLHEVSTGSYRYALYEDINAARRPFSRHIGNLMTSGSTVTVFFNTLQQEIL